MSSHAPGDLATMYPCRHRPPPVTDLTEPPQHIAIVRFSALGDVVMVMAAVQALRRALPNARITWITSPLAHSLLEGVQGVEFEVMDKPRCWQDYRTFYRRFRDRRFDAVLAMQASLRINLLYPALHAPLKIGFDRTRAREGQWLFCNRRIPFRDSHLVDSFLAFVETLTGQPVPDLPPLQWTFSLPLASVEMRERLKALPRPLLAIHPCASKAERSWLPERYAAVIEQAAARFRCGILLTGGDTPEELRLCAELARVVPQHTLNLCGQTSLKQLANYLGEADVLLAPDTAAVHIARAMDTPVVGLYAVASPLLTGPYRQLDYCVDRHPQAVRKFLGKDPARLPWNTRVHHPGAMALIEVGDVMQQLARVLEEQA